MADATMTIPLTATPRGVDFTLVLGWTGIGDTYDARLACGHLVAGDRPIVGTRWTRIVKRRFGGTEIYEAEGMCCGAQDCQARVHNATLAACLAES